jgi:hypothetical protein
VATFWDSLEHTTDASYYLQKVDSLAFVSMPIYESGEAALRSKHYKPNEHIYYFTMDGLIFFFREYGFELLEHATFEMDFGRDSVHSFAFKRVRY